jgi:hypothetical protein
MKNSNLKGLCANSLAPLTANQSSANESSANLAGEFNHDQPDYSTFNNQNCHNNNNINNNNKSSNNLLAQPIPMDDEDSDLENKIKPNRRNSSVAKASKFTIIRKKTLSSQSTSSLPTVKPTTPMQVLPVPDPEPKLVINTPPVIKIEPIVNSEPEKTSPVKITSISVIPSVRNQLRDSEQWQEIELMRITTDQKETKKLKSPISFIKKINKSSSSPITIPSPTAMKDNDDVSPISSPRYHTSILNQPSPVMVGKDLSVSPLYEFRNEIDNYNENINKQHNHHHNYNSNNQHHFINQQNNNVVFNNNSNIYEQTETKLQQDETPIVDKNQLYLEQKQVRMKNRREQHQIYLEQKESLSNQSNENNNFVKNIKDVQNEINKRIENKNERNIIQNHFPQQHHQQQHEQQHQLNNISPLTIPQSINSNQCIPPVDKLKTANKEKSQLLAGKVQQQLKLRQELRKIRELKEKNENN